MLRERIKRFHFVGIGGIGMSGIARILLEMGYEVSGSDLKENKNTETLRRKGARIFIGHSPENVKDDVQVVVYSSAVREDNPEIKRARALGIPVIPRGEMLAELFKLKEGIAVSGSHGKTTTTSMIAHILEEAGYDPTVIIGGILHRLGGNAKLGSGDLLISEADESDGSFLKLSPVVAVITNVDREHLDFYRDFEEIKEAFLRFADSVPFYGFSVMNGDDPNLRCLSSKTSKRVVLFGTRTGADILGTDLSVEDGRYKFRVLRKGELIGKIVLGIPGRHNVLNALASVATCLEIGVDFPTIREALESFRNAERRMELKGYFKGSPIYDDYGHHPTEIRAVLESVKDLHPDRRILLIFQPHRYSRTYHLFEEFVRVLRIPDVTVVTEIYPAGEKNTYGVSGEKLARSCGAIFARDEEDIFSAIERFGKGSVILFMGAGDITRTCERFFKTFSCSLP
ncbi:MAG: UDP-N-acetylmuramate--L-alanine ligase [Aquificota bacterium]|nr:UDP-N-acetylmuramate--L-alanine ligase [Aquificota bacterium]